MKVLVDTCVWSLALRRGRPPALAVVEELRRLIADGRVQMIGPVRQELLSGIRDEPRFNRLARHLAAFPDLALESEEYVEAARYLNRCRASGVQGSNTDFLLCAAAVRNGLAIYTLDEDFARFADHVPITLHRA